MTRASVQRFNVKKKIKRQWKEQSYRVFNKLSWRSKLRVVGFFSKGVVQKRLLRLMVDEAKNDNSRGSFSLVPFSKYRLKFVGFNGDVPTKTSLKLQKKYRRFFGIHLKDTKEIPSIYLAPGFYIGTSFRGLHTFANKAINLRRSVFESMRRGNTNPMDHELRHLGVTIRGSKDPMNTLLFVNSKREGKDLDEVSSVLRSYDYFFRLDEINSYGRSGNRTDLDTASQFFKIAKAFLKKIKSKEHNGKRLVAVSSEEPFDGPDFDYLKIEYFYKGEVNKGAKVEPLFVVKSPLDSHSQREIRTLWRGNKVAYMEHRLALGLNKSEQLLKRSSRKVSATSL